MILGIITGPIMYFLGPMIFIKRYFNRNSSGVFDDDIFWTAIPLIVSIILSLILFILNSKIEKKLKIINSIIFIFVYMLFYEISVIASWIFSGDGM